MLMALHLLDAISGYARPFRQSGLGELQLFPPADNFPFQEFAYVGEFSVDAS